LAIGRAIELTWLAVIVLTPLVFAPPGWFAFFETPKIAVVQTSAAIIVSLWAVDAALAVWGRGAPTPRSAMAGAVAWLRAEPVRWTVAAAAATVAIVVLSTIASPVPRIETWGFEPGRDGQSLSLVAPMMTVFFAITLRLRSPAQLTRLVAAFIVVGILVSVYALLQHLDVDPYQMSRLINRRVIGTLRNPIFLGSFLLQTLPFTVAVALLLWRATGRRSVGFAGAVVVALVGFVLVLALARGPWVGASVAIITFAGLGAYALGRRLALRATLVLVAAAVLVGVALAVVPTPQNGSIVDATIDRLGSFTGTLGGGVAGRLEPWNAAAELIADRPWFASEDGNGALSHLLGYGPDTFLYVYPLASDPAPGPSIPLVKDGHNLWVHTAVEIGVLGALVLLIVFAIPVLAGGFALAFRSRGWSLRHRLLLLAGVAAITGRGVEQLTGVAQASDALLFWAIARMVVAVPGIAARTGAPSASAVGTMHRPQTSRPGVPAKAAAAIAAAVIAIAAMGLLATVTAGNALGSRDAALSVNATTVESDRLRAVDLINSAIAKSPGVAAYRLRAGDLFDNFRLRTLDVDDIALLEGTLAVLEGGLRYNRLSLLLNIRVGEANLELARRGQRERIPEAVAAFEFAADLIPSNVSVQRNTATRLLELGEPERALARLNRALALDTEGLFATDTMVLMGSAYRDLGRDGEAIRVLRDALEREQSERSETQIRLMLESLGAS
jgi:O-antigen ligase